jgi:hypothetical protein
MKRSISIGIVREQSEPPSGRALGRPGVITSAVAARTLARGLMPG